MTETNNIQTAVIKKAVMGDADAQAWLYRQYSKAMFNICIRITGHQLSAEDILHDAFITAYNNLGSLKQPEAFGGWLKQIVVNTCIAHCKKSFKWDDWDEPVFENLQDETNGWWATISLSDLHNEIKKLPDGCREIFVLYAMEDYTHKAIAAQIGITESTSKSQYHRARKLLRERITSQILTNG